jgi:phage shock protein A
MNFFKRIFKLGEAEANAAIDKLEDPIKMTEQGIRDLKKDLEKSLKAMAEVKALHIRTKNDLETYTNKANDYESKAMLLVQKASNGEMAAEESDRLATEALLRKEENVKLAAQAQKDADKLAGDVSTLEANVRKIKSTIAKYENELKTLKARVKVSKATQNLNKQMANIDSSSTISMLEKMKVKVAEQEALAESYGEIANDSKSLDEEIDAAIGGDANAEASDALAALKAKMNKEA